MALTPKQQRFVDEYLIDLNATQAARRAGYSARRASEIGHQQLQKTTVSDALAAAMQERSERMQVDADWVLRNLKEAVERAMQHKAVLGKDGEPTGQYVFDASAAIRALEIIAKHLGMFPRDAGGTTGTAPEVKVIEIRMPAGPPPDEDADYPRESLPARP